MSGTAWIRVGAIAGAIGVLLGSFGAHGLAPTPEAFAALSPDEAAVTTRRLANFDTGVRYHLFHALAIVAVGLTARPGRATRALDAAGWLFAIGVIAFSGSLYGIGVGGPKALGMIAPIGGVAMILGWVALAIGASHDSHRPPPERPISSIS